MRRIIPFITLCGFLVSFQCLAFRNEPDSFGGIKFGTTIDKLPYMAKIRSAPQYTVYRNKNDNLRLFDADLEDISYMFMKKKLFGVACVFRGLSNYNKIKQNLIKIHGEGLDRSRKSKYDKDFIWYGEAVPIRIVLSYVESEDAGGLSYIYSSAKILQANPSTTELLHKEYTDPKGFFKITPPAGWLIQEYPKDPRGKVVFMATHYVGLCILAMGVNFDTYESLLQWAEAMEKKVGIDTNIQKILFLERTAIRRNYTFNKVNFLAVDFIEGNIKHNLQYSGASDDFSKYFDVAMKSINTYKPIFHYLSNEEIKNHEVGHALRLVQISHQKGDLKAALEILKKALEMSPKNIELLKMKEKIESEMKTP
jgi:hypothetical protein